MEILRLYGKYADIIEDSIMPEGISVFLQDLNYKAEEFQMLVLAWKFK